MNFATIAANPDTPTECTHDPAYATFIPLTNDLLISDDLNDHITFCRSCSISNSNALIATLNIESLEHDQMRLIALIRSHCSLNDIDLDDLKTLIDAAIANDAAINTILLESP